jgi:hypothetical protein
LALKDSKLMEPVTRLKEWSVPGDLGFDFSVGGVNRVPGLSIRANLMNM